jgi:hypothetical protein
MKIYVHFNISPSLVFTNETGYAVFGVRAEAEEVVEHRALSVIYCKQ